jgi:hypothetical protein
VRRTAVERRADDDDIGRGQGGGVLDVDRRNRER